MASHYSEAAKIVHGVLTPRRPLAWRDRVLPADVALGPTGLGLDSIAIVELLLDCEQALAAPFPPTLFDDGPLTVGRLVQHAALALEGGRIA